MRNETDKTKLIVRILMAVVVLLVVIVLYLAVFQQQYNSFVNQKRIEGIDIFISQVLIPQLQAKGYVQIPLGGNRTIYLVPARPRPTNSTTGNTSKTSVK